MKCYPIVLSSTLNPLYENLPVVIVDRWEEATEEFLKKKREEFIRRDWDFDKLYIPYWFEKVRAMQKKLRISLIERVVQDCKARLSMLSLGGRTELELASILGDGSAGDREPLCFEFLR